MRKTVAAALTASAIVVASIAGWESYRDVAYDDGVGVQTYGFGSTRKEDGKPVQSGDRTDPVRALKRLAADADTKAKAIGKCIGDVPMYQYEFDAYVSLTYNIGTGAFCGSTLVKRLQQDPPDYTGACREILRWNKAGGKVLRGLDRRRQAEYQVCIGSGQ